MTQKSFDINDFVQSLLKAPHLNNAIAFHQVLPAQTTRLAQCRLPWPPAIANLLSSRGLQSLYSHQAQALNLIQAGRHVVIATPTASGKSLIYNLPLIEAVLHDPSSRGLYLSPLKALAQDQLRNFVALTDGLQPKPPTAAIYDGDTSAWQRRKLRANPPHLLMTNPEMLHLSFLPYHHNWSDFFSALKFIVVDEVHIYRGIMGSHMAQVFRRLQRICDLYGSRPQYVFTSATVSNPAQLAGQLTGLKVQAVTRSGAARGRRHLVFVNPEQGLSRTAVDLLAVALQRELRTIVYTQSRKLAELIAMQAQRRGLPLADRISAYRAGFLPEERRRIERQLSSGQLLAVISTSALELGIDIGDLDLCLLVGYPGSMISTWQRSGRVGRHGQDSALVLIAGEDALDQYFMRNPTDFLQRQPEAAVLNPFNPDIVAAHVCCAAAEKPLAVNEPFCQHAAVRHAIQQLEQGSELLRSAEGDRLYARRRRPQRKIDLRGAGRRFRIISSSGRLKGEIDELRAYRETHPGAIYLHRGRTYRVDGLDLGQHTVTVTRVQIDHYTRVRGHKDTEILALEHHRRIKGTRICRGRLKITDQVTGFETRRQRDGQRMGVYPLDLPPVIFETEGLWLAIDGGCQQAAETARIHFMGALHALEHAAIGILPLVVLADRNDLGGIATNYHPQVQGAAVFIYDGVPGGAGLTRQAYDRAEELLTYTLRGITSCPCEAGCPSCVHSPKCGSGNRPIDKAGAMWVLQYLQSGKAPALPTVACQPSHSSKGPAPTGRTTKEVRYGVFDLETQRSAQEVGGWHQARLMRISCSVLYDSVTDSFNTYLEDQVPALIRHLQELDLVVGFNIIRFDYRVLSGYTDYNFRRLTTLDILQEVHRRLGFRLSLAHLAHETLGVHKNADGLQALRWWKQGRMEEIIAYCRKDVIITRDLYRQGRDQGFLLFSNKARQRVRLAVDWRHPALPSVSGPK